MALLEGVMKCLPAVEEQTGLEERETRDVWENCLTSKKAEEEEWNEDNIGEIWSQLGTTHPGIN